MTDAPMPGAIPPVPLSTHRSTFLYGRISANPPTFGTPGEDSIRVAIFGAAVPKARQGYYYLPKNSTVRDAITAAQELRIGALWYEPYSGIGRRTAEGGREIIWFNREQRAKEEGMLLKEGDHVCISHEYY